MLTSGVSLLTSSDDYPRAANFEHYLSRSGWALADSAHGAWLRHFQDREFQVVVPTTSDSAEYAMLAREALKTISFVERRPSVDVWNDILLRGADTLAFRYTPKAPSGQAPLPLAQDALKSIRDLLTGSASALFDDRAVLPNRRPAPAERLSEQVRIGVAPGSFVVRATVPLADNALEDSAYDATLALPGATFARQVIRRVVKSLRTAQELASAVEKTGKIETFGSGEKAPVNATELQALGQLGGPSNEPYAMRYSTSPLDLDDGERLGTLSVSHTEQLVFEEAAEYLRKRQPREDIVLIGPVVQLRRESKIGPGKITVEYNDPISGGRRRVQVELTEEDYSSALHAHEAGHPIRVEGVLARGRPWRLVEPTGFNVVDRPRPRPTSR